MQHGAYHEAGHAVVADSLGIEFRELSIAQPKAWRAVLRPPGIASWTPSLQLAIDDRLSIERRVMAALAGREAERKRFGTPRPDGDAEDRRLAIELLASIAPPADVPYLGKVLMRCTR